MASRKLVDEAVWAAISTATVDRAAPEPERVRFDRDTLARVTALYQSPSSRDEVIRAQRRSLARAIEVERNMDLAYAAGMLEQRLRRGRAVRYEETPDGPRLTHEPEPDVLEDPWLSEHNFFG